MNQSPPNGGPYDQPAGQQPYGGPGYSPYPGGYGYPPPPPKFGATPAGRQIRQLSLWGGVAVLLFFGMQYAVAFLMDAIGIMQLYHSNELFREAFGIFYSLLCTGLPFLLIYKPLKGIVPELPFLPLDRPRSGKRFGLSIPMGVAACLCGSMASDVVQAFLGGVGIEASMPQSDTPHGLLATAVFVVSTALLPALIEEFALRGIIMQPLRKFGDWFAILMSALLFAVMHGNFPQAVFAFVCGVVIGYLVICTGSLWTGIAIHFCNNLLSVGISVLEEQIGSQKANLIGTAAILILLAAGGVCAAFYFLDRGRVRIRRPDYPIALGKRVAQYLFTPAMVFALLIVLVQMAQYIHLR